MIENLFGLYFICLSYVKKNYIQNIPTEVHDVLKNLTSQNILINLRTYDQNSLILYINDHLNNFIHLYIESGENVVFKFNDGNSIKTLVIEYPGDVLKQFFFCIT